MGQVVGAGHRQEDRGLDGHFAKGAGGADAKALEQPLELGLHHVFADLQGGCDLWPGQPQGHQPAHGRLPQR